MVLKKQTNLISLFRLFRNPIMKNITYLEKIEEYIKRNKIVVSSLSPVTNYEKNELNERSVISQTPKQVVLDGDWGKNKIA